MSGKYDDIIHLPHPTSLKHPRMSMQDRAAQFSPFRALTGYEDAVRETARITGQRIELDEKEIASLNIKLRLLLEQIEDFPEVAITYFVPDTRKDGGEYMTAIGRLKKLDDYKKEIVLLDGKHIPLSDIYEIESVLFQAMEL